MKAMQHSFDVNSVARGWSLVALLSALLLAGCGGGGGGGEDGDDSPAPTLNLAVSPPTLTTGGTITLNWSTTNATSCNASGDWEGSKATSGSQDIVASTAGLATFTLTCTGKGGDVSRSVRVTVNAPPTSGPTLVLSETVVDVAALTFAPAPTRTITISLQNLVGPEPISVGGSYSDSGIETASLSPGSGGTAILSIAFRDPSALGPGSYADQITIRACRESPCVNHIAGSPQTISVTYVVTANPNPPTLSFNASSVAVTHDNVDSFGTREDESIQYSIANRGTGPMFTRVTVTGTAVLEGRLNWNGDDRGSVRITLRPPGSLRAGTYTGAVRVDVCRDEACTVPFSGSPGNIDVTYHVTGNALPNTQTLWNARPISGAELVTSETRTPVLSLSLRVTNLPPEGLFVRHTPSATGLITGGFNSPPSYISHVPGSDTQFDLTLKAPASLGSGIFTDTMTFEACFDAACSEIVPGSEHVLSRSILITATEGVEYTKRVVLPGGSADSVAWSPVDGFLYVAASAPVGATSNIVQVDPTSGLIGLSRSLNVDDVYHMAVTPDGSYLYAGADSMQTLHRLLLPSLAPDLSIQLGERDSFTPYGTSDIDPIPGEPRSVIVAVKVGRTGEHVAVRVYDDGIQRPEEVGASLPATRARWLVPAAESGRFISWNAGTTVASSALEHFAVDASGIRVNSSITLPLDRGFRGHPSRVGNNLYHDEDIVDAGTGDVVGTIPLPTSSSPIAVLPDERNRRLFVWVHVQGSPVIISYDLDTLQILAYAPMPFGSGPMVLWGDEGIAFANGSSLTILSGPFFSTYRGEPRQ